LEADWEFGMPVTLSIENVPEEMVQRLRERAARHHHSLQREIMAIIEEAVCPSRLLMPDEVLSQVRQFGLSTPEGAAAMVREDRDGRLGR
jgi:plasmid stability protein